MAGLFPEDLKNRVKEANEIVDLIRSYGVDLKRAGRNWKGCCPFHQEKTPSFNVNQEGQYFKCFGCGKSGDVLSFVGEYDRVEFPEALKMLADRVSITVEVNPVVATRYKQEKDWKSYLYKLNGEAQAFYKEMLHSEEGERARSYLKDRGISEESWDRFSIGYSPAQGSPLLRRLQARKAPAKALEKAGLVNFGDNGSAYDYFRGRLMFPIWDLQGRVIGFGGRVLGEGEPKYLNTRDTPLFTKGKTVYALSVARDAVVGKRQAILVEGYTDVIMCHQFGVCNVVAALGTAITPDHVRLLRRQADELLILTDSDAAGERASERSVEILFAEDMPAKIVRLPGSGKDPCEFLTEEGSEAFEKVLEGGESLFDFKFRQVSKRYDLSDPQGQARAAHDLMALISLSPDPIRRSAYRRDIAGHLNLSEQALTFDRSSRSNASRNPVANKSRAEPVQDHFDSEDYDEDFGGFEEGASGSVGIKPEHSLAHAERELLRWMFHQPAWLETLLGDWDLTCMQGRVERIIASAIFQAIDDGKLPPSAELLEGNAFSPAGTVAREVLGRLRDAALQLGVPEAAVDGVVNRAQQVTILLSEEAPEHSRLRSNEAYEMRLQAVQLNFHRFELENAKREALAAKAQGDEALAKAAQLRVLQLQQQMKAFKRHTP